MIDSLILVFRMDTSSFLSFSPKSYARLTSTGALCSSDQHDLLEPGTDPNVGIRRKGVFICEQDGSETYRRFYADIQKFRSSFTSFPIMNVLRVFWKHYLANPFSSILVIFVTSSFQENTSILLLIIRTSIRFSVRRTRGLRGHHGETVTLSWGLAIVRASNLRGFLKNENAPDVDVRSGKLIEDGTKWVWATEKQRLFLRVEIGTVFGWEFLDDSRSVF